MELANARCIACHAKGVGSAPLKQLSHFGATLGGLRGTAPRSDEPALMHSLQHVSRCRNGSCRCFCPMM
jgi:hypothetical protein